MPFINKTKVSPAEIVAPPFASSVFQQMKSTAGKLSAETLPDEIEALMLAVAKAGLSQVAADQILRQVHIKTKVSTRVLRQQLADAAQGLEPFGYDKAHRLAMVTLNKRFGGGAFLKYGADGFYTYNDRYWEPLSDAELGSALLDEVKLAFPLTRNSMALVDGAKRLLTNILAAKDNFLSVANNPAAIVNCLNGEVWLDSMGKPELKPHNPQSYLTSCLPIDYDPLASCPAYDAALHEIFSKAAATIDMVRHWNEVQGYAIQPKRDIACFVMLVGEGSNGKSRLLQTLQHLLGSTAVMSGRITNFQRDKFGIAALVGKKVFVDDDMAVDTILDDGLLKMISEAKQMTTRNPYGRTSFSFRSLALPMMACNSYPMTSDSSYGMTRRAMVISFARKFEANEADPGLFEKIWADELPGILNRALEGLARLRKRGGFDLPVDCKNAAIEFMATANPLAGFIDDRCEKDPLGNILLKTFRESMVAWVSEQGMKKPAPFKALKRQLEGMKYEVTMVQGYARVKGLRLKSPIVVDE
jgi:putative DNA primase/helicase